MPFSDVHQLEIPEPFPLAEFERYYHAARKVLPRPSEHRDEFNRASQVTGGRFRACVEHSEALAESWASHGPHSFEALYLQERNLFEMFVCGVSTLETICYGCYAVLALFRPAFPFDEIARRRRTAPERISQDLERLAPDLTLAVELKSIVSSDEWRVWREYRNTLAHRTSAPRQIRGVAEGTPPPPQMFEYAPTWSTGSLEGDEQALGRQIQWLGRSARSLFAAGERLAGGS